MFLYPNEKVRIVVKYYFVWTLINIFSFFSNNYSLKIFKYNNFNKNPQLKISLY